ncbi:MAG: type II toxin-antitoxin system VapC family toxin [Planctomycetes bacterium]|nr:type II toxin-antitoxin system VapC family toxin [Planctomycetota bacterium]MCC8116246.1 type II toxin-antitoxin system VapC family toxin [Planctomycetota bacterium]MCD7897616.1 type II toxin-antitoxin system VapC family toxin [Planctomycetaceae bacterium]
MRLLLDTQALIWHYEDKPALGKKAGKAIENRTNQLFISAVTVWEMSIKVGLGKLKLDRPVLDIISIYKVKGVSVLPITETHAVRVGTLPSIHRDPFDRMLVSQAQCEGLTIVTVDEFIQQYPIECLW